MRLWDEANGPTILKVNLLVYWLYAFRDAYEATVRKNFKTQVDKYIIQSID